MLRTTITALAASAALALAATGCGDDDEDTTAPPGAGADTAADTTAATTDTQETTPEEREDGDDDAGDEDGGAEPVASADVTLTEFEVNLAKDTLPREGVYTLEVVNEGDATHALESEGPNGETETEEIPPGDSAELDVYFVNGTYKLYCPIGDHEQRGMVAQLRVKR